MPRPHWQAVFTSIGLLLVAACSHDQESVLRATGMDVAPASPAVMSAFDVPLDYDFTDVLDVVERAVPQTFGSLDSVRQVGDDSNRHYAFEATRGPFTATAHDAHVHLQTTLSYAVRGYYKPPLGPTLSAGCGAAGVRPQIVVELVAPLTIGTNWHLQSVAHLEKIAAASDSSVDHCRVSLLRFDVTDRVVETARQAITSRLDDIDRRVAQIDLTKRASGWWERLNKPIRLTNQVWLVLHPERFRLKGVTGTGQMLRLQAGLDAYPTIVTGNEPTVVASMLPPLARDSSATGFRIAIDGTVDYATASQSLTRALHGKAVTQGGRTVTIRSIHAAPARDGRIALAVSFTGDAKGTLRLVGTPTHDAAGGQIVVANLDYDLTTDSDLINAYAWLRSDVLLALLRDKARLDVAPVLDQGKALLEKGLNRTMGGVLTLSATVDSVAVQGLFVTTDGLLVRARAWGNARVSVHHKS